jgi:putative hemin transport protein
MNAIAETEIDTPDAARVAALREGYRSARRAGAVRHRDIAQGLGASEGELIAAHVCDPGVPVWWRHGVGDDAGSLVAHRLQPRWQALLAALPPLGEVMALTRNASCVHEKTGCYEEVRAGEDGAPVGLVLGPAIDLRLFWRHWAYGYVVEESFAASGRPPQRSLQFYDAAGQAVHKVFARPATDRAAWDALVTRFRAPVQRAGVRVQPRQPPAAERPDAGVDVAALRAGWAALRDTHDYFGLLRQHGVTRLQAFRLADAGYAQPVDAGSARELLEAAAASATPIMVFVGNRGTIQIHTGPVARVEVIGPWLNVLDPGFNLHLREDHIASAWVVRKPTVDGVVTSLELFDRDGEVLAMFFGERKPGRPELCAWRRIADALVADPAWAGERTPCASC